jgi:hypothetical protein
MVRALISKVDDCGESQGSPLSIIERLSINVDIPIRIDVFWQLK